MKPIIQNPHSKALLNGALIIQSLSMFVQVICLVGIFTDSEHIIAYCVAFTFFSVTALFGVLMYGKHKKDFK